MSNYRLPEEDRCAPPHNFHYPHDTKAVMTCGNGSGLTLPVDFGRRKGDCPADFVAGTVAIDSRGLNCPTVKVDFSAMINYQVESREGEFSIRLIFQLSRACDSGPKIPLGTWVYEKEVDVDRRRRVLDPPANAVQVIPNGISRSEVEINLKEAFSLSWCECVKCPGCCHYVVEVVDIDTDNVRCLSLTNVAINALAV